jgi:hypothetical protein
MANSAPFGRHPRTGLSTVESGSSRIVGSLIAARLGDRMPSEAVHPVAVNQLRLDTLTVRLDIGGAATCDEIAELVATAIHQLLERGR